MAGQDNVSAQKPFSEEYGAINADRMLFRLRFIILSKPNRQRTTKDFKLMYYTPLSTAKDPKTLTLI